MIFKISENELLIAINQKLITEARMRILKSLLTFGQDYQSISKEMEKKMRDFKLSTVSAKLDYEAKKKAIREMYGNDF